MPLTRCAIFPVSPTRRIVSRFDPMKSPMCVCVKDGGREEMRA